MEHVCTCASCPTFAELALILCQTFYYCNNLEWNLQLKCLIWQSLFCYVYFTVLAVIECFVFDFKGFSMSINLTAPMRLVGVTVNGNTF